MLNNLASLDGDSALGRRLQYHTKPAFYVLMKWVIYLIPTGMLIYYLKLFPGDMRKNQLW